MDVISVRLINNSVVVLEKSPCPREVYNSLSLSLDHKFLENCPLWIRWSPLIRLPPPRAQGYGEEWLTYWYQILLTDISYSSPSVVVIEESKDSRGSIYKSLSLSSNLSHW